MARLFRAFIFKISKDITFRITLIIGAAVAVFTTGIYLILSSAMSDEFGEGAKILTGQGMLISSLSPVQNFGIAIPINLISFTVLEFTQGTIRNKIIAGHSKFKIYSSLYLTGLVYGFALLITYVGICTGLGSIFGGFDANGTAMVGTSIGGKISAEFLLKFVALGILSYVSIISFTLFIVTTFRSMGPSIPLVIVGLMGCYFLAYIFQIIVSTMDVMSGAMPAVIDASSSMDPQAISSSMEAVAEETTETVDSGTMSTLKNVLNVLKVVDPLYGISAVDSVDGVASIDNVTFFAGVGSNIFYAAAFFGLGSFFFQRRDIK